MKITPRTIARLFVCGITFFCLLHFYLNVENIEVPTVQSDQRSSRNPLIKSKPKITKTSRPKAAIVILCRNEDDDGIITSITSLQTTFNDQFKYPYVFMNDVPFTQIFINRITLVLSAPAKFVTLDSSVWSYPSHIDRKRAAECMRVMSMSGINYGGSLSYRHMCRFYSGFFFRNDALAEYDFYWRLEPGVKFYCKIEEDPFQFMQDNGKVYGFNVAIYESVDVIESLGKTALEWAKENKINSPLMPYFLNDVGDKYNMCHFWSNFEIARLDLWRNEHYLDFFNHLDNAGGFYYERWGDAPIHSLYIGMTLRKDQIHYFNKIGYLHTPYYHCDSRPDSKCTCPKDRMWTSVDHEKCLERWFDYKEKPWSYTDI